MEMLRHGPQTCVRQLRELGLPGRPRRRADDGDVARVAGRDLAVEPARPEAPAALRLPAAAVVCVGKMSRAGLLRAPVRILIDDVLERGQPGLEPDELVD